MTHRYAGLLPVLFLCCACAAAQTPAEQTMEDFSFSGFGEKGKKSWDLKGKSADIGSEVIRLNDISSNFYGANDTVTLTAEKGDFNRRAGSLHLQDDVVVQSSSGVTLTTESLDWDRVKETVSTNDQVNISKEDITITGQGAQGFPDLRKVNLQKDVQVTIAGKEQAAEAGKRIVITCDGPLQVDYQKGLATFSQNVKVDLGDSQIYSDTMEVYFAAGGGAPAQRPISAGGTLADLSAEAAQSKISKIIARGSVRVVRGANVSYSDEAVYSAAEAKLTLSGRPKLVIISAEQLDAPTGN